ncbi:MAG: NAD(P)/FAD-dependent oxidoreductase [Lachnospiraceae bacterium]|nr:NAD(P)/FAD-dependent oxidoreductase [Lachnospiraceae bacterium]
MRVIVVGGGAAGMMAAIAAAQNGAEVTLLERNEKLGKKLFITGKGRCNVTNAGDMDNLFANVMTNAKFLYSAFYGFDNRAVMELIETAGCPLKTERGGRVFPVSDHSSDIIAALAGALKRLRVEIRLRARVKSLWWEDNTEQSPGENVKVKKSGSGIIRGVLLESGERLEAQRVILATGGLSYSSTGSTGDGYLLAEESGHNVTERSPSLVPFKIREDWCRELMGVSLRNVSLSLRQGNKEIFRDFGEMLFTHFGVSGPLVLSASSYYVSKCRGEAELLIDLKPALDAQQLDKRVLRDFEESRNRQFKNSLGQLFPAKLIPVMIRLTGIPPEKPVNEITREERRNFVSLIKALPMTVIGVQGYEEAIVTKGGVTVRDVNPSTMESKKVQGLYFAGEMLDVDALTGGYNLQIAWSTGHLAGVSAAR